MYLTSFSSALPSLYHYCILYTIVFFENGGALFVPQNPFLSRLLLPKYSSHIPKSMVVFTINYGVNSVDFLLKAIFSHWQ
jgi:type III secretory pathway component EscT